MAESDDLSLWAGRDGEENEVLSIYVEKVWVGCDRRPGSGDICGVCENL